MHPVISYCKMFLAMICCVAAVIAQSIPFESPKGVFFHEPKRLDSAPQPFPSLQHVTAELTGRLVGQRPNISIEFILSLQNNWSQDVTILDPLDSLYLQFTTIGNKLIPLPHRVPKALIKSARDKKDMPFPAPVVFRRIVRGTLAGYQKEEAITIPSGAKVEIAFESEAVVMEKVMEALRAEAGENARSFKASAGLVLLNAPPQPGGRSLDSDWIFFKLPAQ